MPIQSPIKDKKTVLPRLCYSNLCGRKAEEMSEPVVAPALCGAFSIIQLLSRLAPVAEHVSKPLIHPLCFLRCGIRLDISLSLVVRSSTSVNVRLDPISFGCCRVQTSLQTGDFAIQPLKSVNSRLSSSGQATGYLRISRSHFTSPVLLSTIRFSCKRMAIFRAEMSK